MRLTNTGNTTNKPFCPMPSNPTQNAKGQWVDDVSPLERASDSEDMRIKSKLTVNKSVVF
ncbi:hypothetical protein KD5_07270 [Yersinia pseudotuberculosis]|uniref:Uncharacterized protein n=3 Tax=Yersinia pestis TaxID=632 RepID=Q8CKK4_YERPE|nr:hypothetical [Yersinia pestis KIM10+]EIR68265.1 hypothetical protein YPPY25_1215 [Yersinia pestis PY-25]KGA51833.1 hypothetical protein DJ56_4158 [Yersinia pestis]BCU89294.1 hypothetical protein YP72344_07890 [Yersinia pseudotuberculosis]BET61270.1 hypothetical protein YPSE1_07290 [Yersinia pseudotuberculosis]